MPASYTELVRPDIGKWLESVRYKREGWGKYPFHAKTIAPYSLHASDLALRLLDELRLLHNVGESEREEAAAYILSSQDPDDGYFKDRFEDVSVYTGFNSWEEIWNQRSSVVQGLKLLGYSPRFPLPSRRFTDLGVQGYPDWLDSLNWENPGKCAEMISAAMIAFGETVGPELRDDGHEPFSSVFSFWEKQILDSASGLPVNRGCRQEVYLIAGIARILSAYIYFGRKYPYAEKSIDFILGYQKENGDFSDAGNAGNAGMSVNYNVLMILRELNYQLEGGHRVEDIQSAGNMLAHRVLRVYRKSDGGFSTYEEKCLDSHYSVRLSEAYPISDMPGTLTAFRCLMFVDEWNSGIIFGTRRRPFEY